MLHRLRFALALALAALAPACASDPPPRVLAYDDPLLRGMGWLAGPWFGEGDGNRWEEHWLAADGGSMFAIHRTTQDGRLEFFEYLRIRAHGNGQLTYFVSSQGRPAVQFELTDQSSRRVVFENRAHDFPKRIEYWIDSRERLHTRADLGPADRTGQEWIYNRAREVRIPVPAH
jgi:hypothetical protein